MTLTPTTDSTIAQRVRTARIAAELTQSELACLGVSRTYISLIERGTRRPSTKAIRAIAPSLGVSVYWLETGHDDPAVRLARLALKATGPVTPQMRRLARRILNE